MSGGPTFARSHARQLAVAVDEGEGGMDTLWIVSGAVVVSIVATVMRTRRSTPRNLGFVSRNWILRHSTTDQPGV